MALFSRFFSSDPVKKLQPVVDQVNALEKEFEVLKAEDFSKKTNEWRAEIKERLDRGEKEIDVLSEYLPRAFALVREAAKRTIGQRHYDVQLMGGMVLHQGKIAEMRTGEGKTLVATLPLYLNALSGKGVHLVTVNDYLARLQGSWMGKVYHYLGLSTGVIGHSVSYLFDPNAKMPENIEENKEGVVLDVENLVACHRRDAYAADITYGTNNEYGFDYLRDNMAQDLAQVVQRDLHYAIVDEVDSILIDEARTPLIISAPDTESSKRYQQFASVVENLTENEDYNIDEKLKAVTLTENGIAKLEKLLGIDNIYVEGGVSTVHHIEQALRAKTLFKKDRDYVIKDGEIIIVDEFTGRLMYGRRYSEGLHQAIEAKEGVEVQQESKTLATITFQNYFRLFKKLSGMTGTAATEAEELHKIYNIDVVIVPTHRPIVRKDEADLIYQTEAGKLKAVAVDIKRRHELGQPVLVGTTSIAKNEELAEVLQKAGVPFELLNAKNHEREAHIIAQAGKLGAVTVATNMAGRGVDIILGGNPPDTADAEKVKQLGGLHVIGTERHESRRIDNQLRGRAGRQGDPGSSQFYLSLEDDLMRLFGGDRLKKVVGSLGLPEDEPIQHGLVSKSIEGAQKKIEGLNFDRRKHVVEYDDVVNKHRTVIYERRKKLLTGEEDLRGKTIESLQKAVADTIATYSGAYDGEFDKKEIVEVFNTLFPLTEEVRRMIATEVSPEILTDKLQAEVVKAYDAREKELGGQMSRSIEKFLWLRVIDQFWQEHLDTMEHLRDSVRLQGYGQRDPLVEYKREGFAQFQRLLDSIDKHFAFTVFKVTIQLQPQAQEVKMPTEDPGKKVGRNDPCWCGSGKKFKHCHGK